mgnify:FL=1
MKKENTIESYIVDNQLDMPRVFDEYYHYVSKIIKNKHTIKIEDEEEMIADVFLILWKNKDRLDRKAVFSPYIAGITKRLIYRKYRELSRTIEFSQYENEMISRFNVDSIVEQKEMNDCITKNLKALGDTEYEIFKKFYYEGKKVKQIAQEMNLSSSNIKTKLHRTRKKIKEILKVGGF